jgi:pimeloyl-ACP methyl ester carboxylesterase
VRVRHRDERRDDQDPGRFVTLVFPCLTPAVGARVAGAAALLAAVAVSGCSSHGTATVNVEPSRSLADSAVHIRVDGLAANERIVLRLTARDRRGRLWHSRASFRADGDGRLDLDRVSPLSGTYSGTWPGGLLASLSRKAPPTGDAFLWRRGRPHAFRLAVLEDGRPVATATFRRTVPKVPQRLLTAARNGFYGRYFAPPRGRPRGAPVLIFGGSEGGLSFGHLPPPLLAWRGHPTLALAYFDAPGLPETLSRIPLEYFARALRWLQVRAGGGRIVVISVSRGSEAAQLVGAHYPDLVAAVVAAVPSNSAICGLPDCKGSAWTLRGRAIPFTKQFDFTQPSDDPAAVIPVERIAGPMLLVCAGKDTVWRSCPYARAIEARRRNYRRGANDVVYAYPRAGHFVGSLLPYVAVGPRWRFFNPADERAREDLWPQLLAFLARR